MKYINTQKKKRGERKRNFLQDIRLWIYYIMVLDLLVEIII